MNNQNHPYNLNYFIPGKIEGRAMMFLIDTGCTTLIIGKRVFEHLPPVVKQLLQTHHSMQALLADGSTLPFYAKTTIRCRMGEVLIEEVFIVGKLTDDAILGMPFLMKNECSSQFSQPMQPAVKRDRVNSKAGMIVD